MMPLTCVDVIGRYFFVAPIFGAFELTEMMLAALIFAGLPLVTLRNEHVTVDVLDPITPDWLFRIQHVVACVIGLRVDRLSGVAALAPRGHAWTAPARPRRSSSSSSAYLTYAMSILMALTALALLVLVFRRPQRQHPGEGVGP